MKPRVALLSAFVSPLRSGAEACAEEVAAQLQQRYDIIIVAARMRRDLPRKEVLPSGVAVLRLGIGRSIDKWLYVFLAPLAVRELQPRIVHAVLESFAGMAMTLCAWAYPQAKRILTCQSTNTHLFLRRMHHSADIVTAISSVLSKRAIDLERGDVLRIPNGVHTALFASDQTRERRIDGRILFVGRLEPMKGVDTLLQAFRAIQEEFPRAHLRIVGDGSQRKALEQSVTDLIGRGKITFVGFVPQNALPIEYAQAPIFCALSRSEALGNVFLEAQAAGCGVLATRTGGIPDIVLDGKTGLLVPPESPTVAAEALRAMLRHPERVAELAAAGIENAKKYEWSKIAAEYEAVYASMLR